MRAAASARLGRAVDIVTVRDFDLYAEMLDWIGEKPELSNVHHQSTYAVSCNWQRARSLWLESWNHPLIVGSPAHAATVAQR